MVTKLGNSISLFEKQRAPCHSLKISDVKLWFLVPRAVITEIDTPSSNVLPFFMSFKGDGSCNVNKVLLKMMILQYCSFVGQNTEIFNYCFQNEGVILKKDS